MINSKYIASYVSMFLSIFLLMDCNRSTTPLSTQVSETNTPEIHSQPREVATEIPPPEFMIAFISGESFDPASDRGLNIISSSGEGLKNLTAVHNIHHPSLPVWSPDGSRIAFLDCPSLLSGESYIPERDILYVVSRDGTKLTSMKPIFSKMNVSVNCFDSVSISWSPDSKRIAFRGNSTSFPGYRDIFIVSAEGNQLENFSHEFIYENIISCSGVPTPASVPPLVNCQHERASEASPVWAPDGKSLSFVHADKLYVADTDGNNLKKLTDQEGWIQSINWTPDSKHVIYANIINDYIYSVSVETGELIQIGPASAPDLSPDGTTIAFSGVWPDDATYVMDLNGQNIKKIFASFAGPPDWSPDGNFVVLMGQQTIWIVSKNGDWKDEITEIREEITEITSWAPEFSVSK